MTPLVKPEYNPEYISNNPFSSWHRKLNEKYYTTDIDFLEIRNKGGVLTIVGAIESKCNNGIFEASIPLGDFQREVFLLLSKQLKIPFLYIQYNEELTIFRVRRLYEDVSKEIEHYLTEPEMIKYMEKF